MHIDFLLCQTLQTLTKFIEKNIYIHNTEYIQYENISCDVSNDMYLVSRIFIYFPQTWSKFVNFIFSKNLYASLGSSLRCAANDVLFVAYNSHFIGKK